MALFPKIQSPCPYLGDLDEIISDGRCGLCDEIVHDLTAMSDAERRHLVETREGSLCVRYRVLRPALAAMAISLTATPALASDRLPASQQHPADKPNNPATKPSEPLGEIVVGGISAPPAPHSRQTDSVRWTEETSATPKDKPH